MKLIFTTLVLMILLIPGSVIAQTTVGITAGASFANVSVKAAGFSFSPKLKAGIIVGLFVDAPLSSNLSFQPALNFVQKGYLVNDGSVKDKVNINYVEIPLNFVYNTGKTGGFFIGGGPSVAFGISGKEKYTDKDFPEDNLDEKIKFGSDEDKIKRLDFGANVLAGYKFAGGFMISGNYNLGLSNIGNKSPDFPEDDGTIKNRYFAIKIGYAFSGKKK